MAKRYVILCLLVFPIFSFAQTEPLVIRNASIIDVKNNTVIKDKDVIIQGNKIVSIGGKAAIPAQARVIDAKGKYLIPVLWDMHTLSLRKGRSSVCMMKLH